MATYTLPSGQNISDQDPNFADYNKTYNLTSASTSPTTAPATTTPAGLPTGMTQITSPSQVSSFNVMGQVGTTGTAGSYLYGTPKTPIAADSIQNQEPIKITSPIPSTTAADTTAASGQQTFNSVQDYINAANTPKTAEQLQADAISARINELLPQTMGQGAALQQEEARLNIPGLTDQLNQINTSIASKLAEYNSLKTGFATASAALQSDASPFRGQGRGIPLEFVRGQEAKTQAQLQYDQTNTLNTKASEISLLQAQSLGLQGQLSSAQEAAQKAVDLKYSGVEEELAVKQAQLQLLQPTLSKQEKIQADALNRFYDDQKQRMAEEKAAAKNNVTEALANGITTRYINRNGKFYRTMDGKEFNSEAEFFADAGVTSFPEAYKRGLVSDLNGQIMSDKNIISQLRAKYFDAGINFGDTLETATKKLENSNIYQKETYVKPEDIDGLTPGQINTTINSIANAFDNEQIVKNYNTTQEGYQTLQKIGVNTTSPADDIAFIYGFAKIMDPNSVVREGEYNTIQQYAQTWADTFGFKANRIFSNTSFLSADAKQKMLNALKPKVETIEQQYTKLRSEYQRQIDDARMGAPRTITDYGINSNTPTPIDLNSPDWKPQVDVIKEIYPNATDDDIRQILGFSGVGGDTNLASRVSAVYPQGSTGGQCTTFLHKIVQFPSIGDGKNEKIASVSKYGIPASRWRNDIRIGDVVVTGDNPTYGHTFMVNAILPDGSLRVTESNWKGNEKVTHNRIVSPTSPSIYGAIRGTLKLA